MKSFLSQNRDEGIKSKSTKTSFFCSIRVIRVLLVVGIMVLVMVVTNAAPGINAHSEVGSQSTLPASAPVTDSNWKIFSTSNFGYSIEYPSFLNPSEQADQLLGAQIGVPSDITFGDQVRVISRIPPLPDDVVARHWGEGKIIQTIENQVGMKLERASQPIGGGATMVTVQYLFRSEGADYFIVTDLPTDSEDQDQLSQADIDRMVRSFRILPDRQYTFSEDTVAATEANAFDFFVNPPDGGTRAPAYASYNVRNPYLNYWASCYNKSMSQLQHAGEDWFRAAGTRVYAVANGRVIWAKYTNWPGAVAIIEHTLPNDWTNPWGENIIYSVYGHLSTSGLISQWSDVSRGQLIGQVYNQAGNSHVHFEMRRYGDMSDVLRCPTTGFSSWQGPGYTDSNVDPGTYGYVNPSDWVDSHRKGNCYDLNVNLAPAGSGSVDLNPPPECNNGTQYYDGAEVALTAVEDNPSYSFGNWSGDIGGAGSTTELILVTMDQNRDITANFMPLDGTMLRVEPTDAGVAVGGESTVEIVASDISGLYGAQMELHFDPTKVKVVDADDSAAGIQIAPGSCPAPDFVVTNSADNVKGIISFVVTSFSPSLPCDGGVVMRITFRGLAPGSSPLHFEDWLLSGSDGLEIPADAQDGTLTILNLGGIEGKVVLQGRTDHGGATVCADDGSSPVCVQTSADGRYSIDVDPGNYTVTVEMERYLDAEKLNIPVTAGSPTTLADVTCLGGDSKDDCVVNILDLTLMGGRFNLTCNDAGWDAQADINDDCTVNILDMTMAGGNFEKSCPVNWP